MISRCYGGVGRPPRRQRRHSIERSPEKSGGDWATPSACLTPTTSATRWLSSGRSSTVSHRRRCGRPAPRLGLHRRGGRPTAPDGLRLRLRHGSPLPAEHGVALARRSPGGKGTKQWANSGASSVTRSCRPVFPWWAWPRSERGCDWSSSSSLGPRPGLDPQDPEHEPGRALSQPEVQGPGRGARAERRAGGNSGVVGDIDTSRDGGRLRLSVGRTRPGADPVATGEVEWGGAKSSGAGRRRVGGTSSRASARACGASVCPKRPLAQGPIECGLCHGLLRPPPSPGEVEEEEEDLDDAGGTTT